MKNQRNDSDSVIAKFFLRLVSPFKWARRKKNLAIMESESFLSFFINLIYEYICMSVCIDIATIAFS